MATKLSPQKLSKIMDLYLHGCSQAEIALKLKINQATVSLHLAKFKHLTKKQGLKTAAKEHNVMDIVESLHSLSSELDKSGIVVEEVIPAVELMSSLQKQGITEEKYEDVILASIKLKDDGFLKDAVKLSKLEKKTGMNHSELVDHYIKINKNLIEEKLELDTTYGEFSTAKEELAEIDKKKKAAGQSLKALMDQLGLDMERLKKVEDVALLLKAAEVSNKELNDDVKRLELLNKAGIALDTFAKILQKAKVPTTNDQGAALLKNLSEHQGLAESIKDLQVKAASLQNQVKGLEAQAQLKGKLDIEVSELKAEKASLEASVANLHMLKIILDQTQGQVNSLTEKKTALFKDIEDGKTYQAGLAKDIKEKEQYLSDLKKLQTKRFDLLGDLSTIQNKLENSKSQLLIFKSFLGLIHSSATKDLRKFADVLPSLIDEVEQGKNSPNVLRAHVLKTLSGNTLRIMRCRSCGNRFSSDKASPTNGQYICPRCCAPNPVVDLDEASILQQALASITPHMHIAQPILKLPEPPGSMDQKGV